MVPVGSNQVHTARRDAADGGQHADPTSVARPARSVVTAIAGGQYAFRSGWCRLHRLLDEEPAAILAFDAQMILSPPRRVKIREMPISTSVSVKMAPTTAFSDDPWRCKRLSDDTVALVAARRQGREEVDIAATLQREYREPVVMFLPSAAAEQRWDGAKPRLVSAAGGGVTARNRGTDKVEERQRDLLLFFFAQVLQRRPSR